MARRAWHGYPLGIQRTRAEQGQRERYSLRHSKFVPKIECKKRLEAANVSTAFENGLRQATRLVFWNHFQQHHLSSRGDRFHMFIRVVYTRLIFFGL